MAKLTADDGAPNDQFGASVGVDGESIVIGALGDDNLRGSAYVFSEIVSPVVSLADPNLKNAIRETRQALFRNLTVADLHTLTALSAAGSEITDLTGLENAVNLTFLDLDDNQISDLSALSDLGNLVSVFVRNNDIVDLRPLSGLTNLTVLNFRGNQIADLSRPSKRSASNSAMNS